MRPVGPPVPLQSWYPRRRSKTGTLSDGEFATRKSMLERDGAGSDTTDWQTQTERVNGLAERETALE